MAASCATAFWLPAIAACARAAACLAMRTSRLGVRELDLQAVVLLAERVDLVRQLGGLRDKLVEGRLRGDRLRLARAALEQHGHGDHGRGKWHDSSANCTHVDARY